MGVERLIGDDAVAVGLLGDVLFGIERVERPMHRTGDTVGQRIGIAKIVVAVMRDEAGRIGDLQGSAFGVKVPLVVR